MNGFMKASDIAEELGISMPYAYKIIRNLNEQLAKQGYITISGRVSKQYFKERLCYGEMAQTKGGG